MTKRLTDSSFRYYRSEDTDITRTFRRVRAEKKAEAEAAEKRAEEAKSKVRTIKKGSGT